jgi:hypothetical protein
METKKQIKMYLPFSGGSVYGSGFVRELREDESKTYKYSFDCERGSIYFNSFSDRQIKGAEICIGVEEYNQHIQDIIKDTLDKGAEKANMIGETQHNNNAPDVTEDFVYVVDSNGPDYGFVVNKESIIETFEETFNKWKL